MCVPCIRQRNVAGLNSERNNRVLIFFLNLLKPRSPFRPLAKGNNTPLRGLYSPVEKALKARVRGARSQIIRDNARNTLLIPCSFLLMLINSEQHRAKSQRRGRGGTAVKKKRKKKEEKKKKKKFQ